MTRWLLFILFSGAGCTSTSSPVAPEGPNLIVLSLDTVRAKQTTPYGYSRDTTPHLNVLAQQGVVFEQAMSPSPWTLPAHVSLLTGRYPLNHGVHHKDHSLPSNIPTLATHFKAHGLRTAAITNSGYLKHRSGLHRHFDAYRTVQEYEQSPQPTPAWDTAKEWLVTHKSERFFLFLHIYDAHSAYASEPPVQGRFTDPDYNGPIDGTTGQLLDIRKGALHPSSTDWSHLRDLYDENLYQTDAALGSLLTHLKEHGLYENTLIVITSDHGEALGEHGGEVLHGRTHYEELLHVPWITSGPGIAPRREFRPVSIVDIAPTVATQMGLPLSFPGDGTDRTRPYTPVPLFAEADQNGTTHHNLRTVRIGPWKLTRTLSESTQTLYHLKKDPGEQSPLNVFTDVPLKQLERALDTHIRREGPAVHQATPYTAAEKALLEALGYLDAPLPKR